MDRDPTARFAALVARPEALVPLDETLLVVASHADPTLDLTHQLARLDALAAEVREPTLDAVRSHLYDVVGFAGDQDTYYDARNSLLPEVLDRRRGIPITLAAVVMEVGRRVGISVEGVGMPGHFLVRDPHQPERLLDPFRGTWLDPAGCQALFARLAPADAAWDDAYLRSAAPTEILARVLANLTAAHRRSGDRVGLCWALDLRLRLPGATPRERRELGLLLGASGRFDEGADVLEASPADGDREAAARLRARLN